VIHGLYFVGLGLEGVRTYVETDRPVERPRLALVLQFTGITPQVTVELKPTFKDTGKPVPFTEAYPVLVRVVHDDETWAAPGAMRLKREEVEGLLFALEQFWADGSEHGMTGKVEVS